MSAPLVAVIATEGVSPFHLAVPEIIFSQILPGEALFRYVVCAENPGTIPSKSGMSVSVEHGLDTLNDADIVIIPFWAHPEEKPSIALLNALLDYLRGHLDKPHDVNSLANFVSMARRTFTRNFTRATGVSPVEWLQVERLRYSQTLLESTDHSVEMIAGLSGFNSPVSYRQGFKQRFGVSPSEWRKMFRGK
ncbi:transcriptional regulator containing an amidase domain and an AraC-type DNA-binding HTH domain [Enterobacteriaceae bacterium strain FGI 57]|jgi:transcriptional regulator, AraC family with amidase-like domain|nr:transcriptional regulator containing an amidase domain and an AraC-type DNA-binding HTH domain [Enterobacteriaceae bacterium strain FGI 57]